MKSIQEHLRQLLQMVPTSSMLQVHLCLYALLEHFKQSPRCQSKTYIAPTKAMDGLIKYMYNRNHA